MTFHEQLMITILDKAIIGFFIVIVGFWLNTKLEKFKGDRALTNEFTKQGLVKISEVWESLYKWEGDVLHYSRITLKSIYLAKDDDIALAMEHVFPTLNTLRNERSQEARRLIENNRFWLSNTLYSNFNIYHATILNHLALLFERPRSIRLELYEHELELSRKVITDYIRGANYSK